jgi:uncharacterized Tic20 family protein
MPRKKADPEENEPKEETPIPDPSPANKKPTKPKPALRTSRPFKEGADASESKPVDVKSEIGFATPYTPRPVSPNEERTWAMLAHLSVLLNLFTGFLGGIAALVIYFVYKDRSRFVAYHAMQAFIFQAITWLGAGLISGIFITLGSALAFLLIPLLCLIPGFLILLLVPISLIYGIIGGVKVNNGEDFKYWQVGDWVRNILEPKPVK